MCVTQNLLVSGSVPLIKRDEFSTLKRLLRVTAYVLKFIQDLNGRIRKADMPTSLSITADDIAKAELYWIKVMQCEMEDSHNFGTWKHQLGMFLDSSGIWRCGGRLAHVDIVQSSQNPVLLDVHHHFTYLAVKDCHAKVLHNGVKETLNELQSRYWIMKGRSFIRKILHQCVICKRFEGKPYHVLVPPPLHECRVRPCIPFAYIGVDYAGPLYLKDTGSKTWICLFTCCSTQAVHLELVPNMTADVFVRCFKRFAARRGTPCQIISDNSTTFESASKIIANMLNELSVKTYFSEVHVSWKFNLEQAPWSGGIFEGMIRSMKRCLKKTIGNITNFPTINY